MALPLRNVQTNYADAPDEVVLENWMAHLDPSIRSQWPLIRLALPGSHDSMMYKMMKSSPITPEAPKFVKWLVNWAPGSVERWVVTQGGDALEQLRHGVRYFDIRVCLYEDQFMLCHGVFSGETTKPLMDIKSFLDTHPQEMVILDFQHVYQCEAKDHQRYCDELFDIFGDKILPRKGTELNKCTLEEMAKEKRQVIIIYRDFRDAKELFWTGGNFPTPWPNTTSISELVTQLEENIKERRPEQGYVTQCVLTPDGKFIAENVFFGLKSSCALPVLQSLSGWIVTRKVGMENWPGHNIFIADFVDLNDYQFVKAVLSLNGLKFRSFNSNVFQRYFQEQQRDRTKEMKWKLFCCNN